MEEKCLSSNKDEDEHHSHRLISLEQERICFDSRFCCVKQKFCPLLIYLTLAFDVFGAVGMIIIYCAEFKKVKAEERSSDAKEAE